MRAPLIPTGWPSAMAPPLTLTRSLGTPRSRDDARATPANASFENREYTLRFVETTLWTNWFFTGGDYSSFTLLRNTTNLPVVANLRWKAASGADVGTPVLSLSIPANGVVIYDARSIMSCPAPTACAAASGSVEVAHSGSPEAIVGSQTTLSGSTSLSFDTLFFQRRAW